MECAFISSDKAKPVDQPPLQDAKHPAKSVCNIFLFILMPPENFSRLSAYYLSAKNPEDQTHFFQSSVQIYEFNFSAYQTDLEH